VISLFYKQISTKVFQNFYDLHISVVAFLYLLCDMIIRNTVILSRNEIRNKFLKTLLLDDHEDLVLSQRKVTLSIESYAAI